jgi:thioesterase domain-containing protein
MNNLDDIYPLSPMQEMMLLSTRKRDGILFNQTCLELEGRLDPTAFRAAWQALTARHAALRTAFQWRGLKRPMQVVRTHVDIPFDVQDWRNESDAERETRLKLFLLDDRTRGFDLTRAPLQRIALIHYSDTKVVWVWSSHHLIMDRWCIGTLFAEFSEMYSVLRTGIVPAPRPAPKYGRYIGWVEGRDRAASLAYWRSVLGDLHAPCLLTRQGSAAALRRGAGGEGLARGVVDADRASALGRFARAHGLTMSTVIQAAWALVINHYTQCRDVVFGVTVSGRPTELPEVESIVGTFINNVPVVWRLAPDAPLIGYARSQQLAQQQRQAHDYLALSDILACSAAGGATGKLFDSLLVWLAPQQTESIGGLTIRKQESVLQTAYPLTLSIAEVGDGYELQLRTADDVELLVPSARLMDRLLATVAAFPGRPEQQTFADIEGFAQQSAAASGVATVGETFAESDAGGSIEGQAIEGREPPSLEMLVDILAVEWEQVLGISGIDPDADFFELGGDSIKAARLHTRILAATRSRIPLLALFESSNIRKMAANLYEGRWPLSDAMATAIAVRADPAHAPLFCIASPEVSTIGYALLARHLQPTRSVYVIQAPPGATEVRRLSPQELPALAQRYVDAIEKIQRSGPYHLLGMCVGAQLSVEVVRILEARGASARFLGIINTWAYFTVSRLIIVHRAANRLNWYRARLATLTDLTPRERWQKVAQVLAPKLGRARKAKAAGALEGAGVASPAAPDEWLEVMGRPDAAATCAPIQSTITVLRIAKQPYWRVRDRTLGWGIQTVHSEVVDLSVTEHLALLREPHVREVASRIDAVLAGGRP